MGYNFTSVYQDDGSETGPGTATYTVNSQKVGMVSISQGNNYFDPTEHLITGSNTVRVTVKDSTGSSRSLSYTIEVISMSISSSIDPALVYSGRSCIAIRPWGPSTRRCILYWTGRSWERWRPVPRTGN